jgi:hypothetical protein
LDSELRLLIQQLRRYVSEHPSCADTTHGIAHWWLGRASLKEEQLVEALEILVCEGVLESRRTGDGTLLYVATKRHHH